MTKEEKAALYTNMVKTIPKAELKGDTIPYTSMNGNMYSYLSKDGVVALRLSENDRNEFLAKHKAKLMEAYGIVQKEYVAVPDNLLNKASEMKHYFSLSYKYASSLKTKPTTKKKK